MGETVVAVPVDTAPGSSRLDSGTDVNTGGTVPAVTLGTTLRTTALSALEIGKLTNQEMRGDMRTCKNSKADTRSDRLAESRPQSSL